MNARFAAVLTLQKVLSTEQPCALDTAMSLIPVSPREEALRKALCQGVCYWYFTLQKWVSILVDKPLKNKDRDLLYLLLIGLYQLYWMRTPDYACLQATTETAIALQKSWAKGFINAVLRKAQLQISTKPPQFLQKARSAWPEWLANQIERAWPTQADAIFAAGQKPGPMTLRVNQQHHSREEYQQLLNQQLLVTRSNANEMAAEPTEFSDVGLRLREPCSVELLPGFTKGWCSIQDEAAQLAAELLNAQPGQRVLDACAAPGGKANHLIERCPNIRELIALEKSASRLALLHSNHQRLGFTTPARYLHADASVLSPWWDGQVFERILLDAPCSASGIIRRHPDIKVLRRENDITALATTQLTLLCTLWQCLAVGGQLLYATCSILPLENIDVIAKFLQQTANAKHLTITANWGFGLEYGRQLLPSIAGPDGFYYALLQKTA
jgi:16S rRNA (cytosine967-C5)-methyltransferase